MTSSLGCSRYPRHMKPIVGRLKLSLQRSLETVELSMGAGVGREKVGRGRKDEQGSRTDRARTGETSNRACYLVKRGNMREGI